MTEQQIIPKFKIFDNFKRIWKEFSKVWADKNKYC